MFHIFELYFMSVDFLSFVKTSVSYPYSVRYKQSLQCTYVINRSGTFFIKYCKETV